MTIGTLDILHTILAVTILLFVSHAIGYIFQIYKQPRVIGELLAGIILGPSLFAYFFPNAFTYIFDFPSTKVLLDILYQLGLFHLLFRTGMELQIKLKKHDKFVRAATWISVMGIVISVAFSFLFLQFFDIHNYMGSANSEPAFIVCFSIAVAISGIAVIARILHDLKLLKTSFAGIILSAAVLEDIVLFIALTIALSMVGTSGEGGLGLPVLLGIENSSLNVKILYHSIITIVFFVVSILVGFYLFRWLEKIKFRVFQEINPLAFLISFMFFMTAIAMLLDIASMFGAFVGGIIAQNFKVQKEETSQTFDSYSFAFFIPIYFALVGIRLNLIQSFNINFFLFFLVACFVAKFIGLYLGARIGKESRWGALNYGIALNGRGAPGIILAALALDAGIINLTFFTMLVMLSLVTSFISGSWLNYIVRKKLPLQ